MSLPDLNTFLKLIHYMYFYFLGHKWLVGKLKIGNIQVADNFGGSAYPSIEEYFEAIP